MVELSAFVARIVALFVPLGEVAVKRMFGGYGLFFEGKMFALISRNDELFLKADAENRDAFIARGSQTHGKMPYYAAPAGALESWRDAEPWVRGALAAAQRAQAKKAPKR